MKVKILATSKEDAEQKVLQKLKFHKIEEDAEDEFNQAMDLMDGVNDMLDIMSKAKGN